MTFITRYLSDFLIDHPEIRRCDIWSDGPSSQFKNKYMAAFVVWLRGHLQLDCLTWNYFATSHGKSSIDSLGATVKRVASRRNRAKGNVDSVIVKDAVTFYDSVQSVAISSVLITKEEIENFILSTPAIVRIIEDCPAIPGISRAHCIAQDGERPQIWDLTVNANVRMSGELSLAPGQCVVVRYDFTDRRGRLMPKHLVGVVTSTRPTTVDFCRKLSDRRFKVNTNDTATVNANEIVRILPQPNFFRGAFDFDDVVDGVDM